MAWQSGGYAGYRRYSDPVYSASLQTQPPPIMANPDDIRTRAEMFRQQAEAHFAQTGQQFYTFGTENEWGWNEPPTWFQSQDYWDGSHHWPDHHHDGWQPPHHGFGGHQWQQDQSQFHLAPGDQQAVGPGIRHHTTQPTQLSYDTPQQQHGWHMHHHQPVVPPPQPMLPAAGHHHRDSHRGPPPPPPHHPPDAEQPPPTTPTRRAHRSAAYGSPPMQPNKPKLYRPMTNKITIYMNPLSPFSRFVMMAATALGHVWDAQMIDFERDLSAGWYLEKNPNGQVPTLEHNNTIVYESSSMIRYLSYIKGPTPFYPFNNPYAIAKIEMAVETMRNKVIKPLLKVVHHKFIRPKMQNKRGDPEVIRTEMQNIDTGIDALEERFFKETPFYIVNNCFTSADAMLCSIMSQLQLVEYKRVGKLDLYFTTMQADPVYRSAHQEFQSAMHAALGK
eukprot:TRINITY_DN2506_c0_g1_i1.p2 TRINITY_DN2506_c0_g1~~TRINITY_DN2506_c0_g1_i1.p2  ORF type:complete len:446 (-),score=65.68 TRINITY_DN2506_c0_g1_i1:1650-2987(-)